jgi:hypothetical protein
MGNPNVLSHFWFALSERMKWMNDSEGDALGYDGNSLSGCKMRIAYVARADVNVNCYKIESRAKDTKLAKVKILSVNFAPSHDSFQRRRRGIFVESPP